MTSGSDLVFEAGPRSTGRWCPICHHEVQVHHDYDLVPVCPVVYPDVPGLFVHGTCLRTERARDAYVVNAEPRSLFVGRDRGPNKDRHFQ